MLDLRPCFYFIGVTTGQSSINQIFPRWMRGLGRDVRLVGVDLPPGAPAERFREVVAFIKHDDRSLGGLVTTHKIDLLRASADMFDELDVYARLCGEVSSISKRAGRLIGRAKDPLTAGANLAEFVPPDHWDRTRAEALCLGAGGAGTAIAVHLCEQADPRAQPAHLTMVDRSPERLDHLRAVIGRMRTDLRVEYVLNEDPLANDARMAALPEGSLVVNATGMGKDRPGSPITAAGQFPRGGLVWELNYRGELDFLRQARAQQATRGLIVADGWRYFLHGWTSVIEDVLDIEIDPARFARWADMATD
jgi:shikimate 5-dehydrogenase